jgi:glycosyltransferase involved in cell wall biosynthesis
MNHYLQPVEDTHAEAFRSDADMHVALGNKRGKLVHVFNHFRSGAIPNIIRDLHPVVAQAFDVEVVVLQNVQQEDAAVRDFLALGIPVHSLGCARWNVPLAWLRLRRFLARAKPDVVHGHMGRSELLSPLSRPRGARVFATFHNVRHGYHPMTRAMMRLSDRLADERICVSHAVADSWYGDAPRQGLNVIHNPVDAARFVGGRECVARVRQEFGLRDGTVLLVNVGRLNRQKRQADLLRAAAQLRFRGDDGFLVVIAGRGEEEGRLRSMIEEMGLGRHVHLAGFRDDVPALVAAADIFVFPSLWEGLGLAALEAMAAGTPVVASNIPPIREYVTHEETGLLFEPENVNELAEHLKELLHDPDRRQRLGREGQARVSQGFNARHIGSLYLNSYLAAEAFVDA